MMISININETAGQQKIAWRKKDIDKYPEEIPAAIRAHVEAILKFVKEDKSDEEIKLDRLIEAIRDKVTDAEKIEIIELYPQWEEGKKVEVGKELVYESVLYEVIQEHTTQSDWVPDTLPALYRRISPLEEDGTVPEIPYYVAPIGATNLYMKGDVMRYTDGKVYRSKLDHNSWTPNGYPAAWELVEVL